jgi:tetratricopeptide (TPR) repeat protein
MTMWSRARFTESYNYLCRALKLGEQIQNDRVIGYACTWLAWTCTDLGLLGEAVSYGERAQEISRGPISDPYLYFKSLGGLGWAYWVKGERKKVFEAGKSLLEYGQRQSNIRSMVMGHYCIGHYHLLAGDLPSAIESYHRATKVSVDPWYYQFPQTMLGICYVMNDQIQEAEDTLKEVVDFSENFGAETAGVPASFFLGITSVAQGQLHRGFKMMEAGLLKQGSESKWRSAFAEYSVGKVYAQVAHGKRSVRLSTITKNIGSMLREVPFAGKKAEEHLNRAIEVASEIGAKGIHGVSLLEMGLLSKISGKRSQAREYITRAIQCLEQSDGVYYLKQARDALEDQT